MFANKKGRFCDLSIVDNQVPGTGIEPAHPCERQILSLLRLPIPPPGQGVWGCNITAFRLIAVGYGSNIFS